MNISNLRNPSEPIGRKTLQFLPIDDQLSEHHQMFMTSKALEAHQSLRGFPCAICLEESQLKQYTDCPHKLACDRCLQKLTLNSLKNKQMPFCLREGCNAVIKPNKSLAFQNFSKSTKRKFNISSIIFEQMAEQEKSGYLNVKACTVVDCEGIIRINNAKCAICQQQYCLQCFRLHQNVSDCTKGRSTTDLLEKIFDFKRCPKCSYAVVKQGGCNKIRCPQCKHNFCAECMQVWSARHHKCGSTFNFLKLPYFWLMETCMGQTMLYKEEKQSQNYLNRL